MYWTGQATNEKRYESCILANVLYKSEFDSPLLLRIPVLVEEPAGLNFYVLSEWHLCFLYLAHTRELIIGLKDQHFGLYDMICDTTCKRRSSDGKLFIIVHRRRALFDEYRCHKRKR